MGSVNIQMKGQRKASIENIADALKRDINAELISESNRYFDSSSVALLCFEKFYYRNGGYASLTVMLTESGDEQTADIIGSGGGEGIFNISWGANSDFADMAEEILRRYGFRTE